MESYIVFIPIFLTLANCAISIFYTARINVNIHALEQSVIRMYTLLESRQRYIAPQPSAPLAPPGYGYVYLPEDPNNQGISGLNVV